MRFPLRAALANKQLNPRARAGHVEQQVYSDLTFKTQQRSFHVLGYAANPSVLAMTGDVSIVGDVHAAYANDGAFAGDIRITKAAQRAQKRKRKGKGTLGEFEDEEEEEEEEVAGEGGVEGEEGAPKKKKEKVQKEYVGPWAGWEGESLETVAPTQEEWEEQEEGGGAPLNKKARSKVVVDSGKKEVGFGEEKSVFHGAFLVLGSVERGEELTPFRARCRQGATRLPRSIIPPHPYRRRRQPPPFRARTPRLLCAEEVHPHLVGAHEGSQQDPALPREWAPYAQCEFGYEDQGAFPLAGQSCSARC